MHKRRPDAGRPRGRRHAPRARAGTETGRAPAHARRLGDRRGLVEDRAAPWVRALRALLQAQLPQTATRAEHEEAFLRLASRYDLPPFLMNQPIALGSGRYAVIDVLFPIQRVALELDTYATHGTPLAFARDRRRDAELSALGHHPMRLTYADTTYDGARSMQLLLAVLERADRELRGDRAGRASR